MTAVYVPGDAPRNEFGQLLLAKDPLEYERTYRFDITPVTDDRPFFFYTVQLRDVDPVHSRQRARGRSEGECCRTEAVPRP